MYIPAAACAIGECVFGEATVRDNFDAISTRLTVCDVLALCRLGKCARFSLTLSFLPLRTLGVVLPCRLLDISRLPVFGRSVSDHLIASIPLLTL